MFTCTCTFFNVQFKWKYWNVHTVQYTWNTTNSTYQHMDITYLYLCMIGVSILRLFPISILHCVLSCAVQDSRSHHHRHSHHHHHSSASQGSHRHTRWVCTCIPVCYICLVTYGMCLQVRLSNRSVCLSVAKTILKCALYTALSSFLGHLQAKMYVCLRPFLLLCSPYNSLAWDLKC